MYNILEFILCYIANNYINRPMGHFLDQMKD